MGGMMANFMFCFMEPVLAFRISEFDISTFASGMFFSIQPISYIIVSFIISWFTNLYANRGLIMMGALFGSFSMLFVGPSYSLPNSLLLMAIGQLLIGGFGLFLMVPVIPEMINSASTYYPDQIIEITDISAGVFNSGLGLGQVLGPIFGSYMTKSFGFRNCCDMIGIVLLAYTVIYFIFGDGFSLLRSMCKEQISKRLDFIRSSPARSLHSRNRVFSDTLYVENSTIIQHDTSHEHDSGAV